MVGVDVAEAKSTAAVLGRYPRQADVNDLAVLAGPGIAARVPTPRAFELAPLNLGNPWIVGVQGLGSAPTCRARLRNLASMAIALELDNKLVGGRVSSSSGSALIPSLFMNSSPLAAMLHQGPR